MVTYDYAMSKSLKAKLLEAIRQLPSPTEDLTNRSEVFEDIIQKWISSARDVPGQTGELLYLLEDSLDTDFSTDGLTGAGLMLFRHLQSLESQCHFNVFVAQVEKREIRTTCDDYARGFNECEQSEDEDDEEDLSDKVHDIDWSLRVTLFGSKVPRTPHNLNMNPDSILQHDVFIDTDLEEEDLPDDYDYDEPSHPEWRGFARYYRSLALLIVPQATTVTYFTENSKARDDYTATDLLEYFSLKCAESRSDDGFLKTLTSMCEIFFPSKDVQSKSRMDIPEPIIVKIFEVAMSRQSQPLFNLVWNNNEAELSPQFFLWILAKLRETPMLTLDALISALDRSVFALKTLSKQHTYLRGLNDAGNKPPKELEAHVLDLFDKMVGLCYNYVLCEQDGEVLVRIACDRQDYEWLSKSVDPLIQKERENIAFILGFCWELYATVTRNELRISNSFNWLKTIVKSLIARLDVNHLISVHGFHCWQQNQAAPVKEHKVAIPQPPTPVTSQTLVNLYVLLLGLNLEEDLRYLTKKLIDQSGRINPFEIANLFVPFVGNLMDVLENRSISLEDPLLSSLVRTIVIAFWNQYVMPGEPIWTEPRYKILDSCSCRFCRSMESNLRNPKRANWDVKESENKSKRHIAAVLKDLAWDSHCSYHRSNGTKYSTWYITRLPTEYEKDKSIWDKKVADARAQLAKFNQRKLWQVLGPDYCCITGNNPPYFEAPRTDTAMVGQSTSAQAPPLVCVPEHTEAMPQVALPPPDNLYGSIPSSHYPPQPLVHDGLPSVEEASHIPIYNDEPPDHPEIYGLPQQPPVVNAWSPGVPPPTAHPGNPAQVSMLGPAHRQNGPIQMNPQVAMPHSQGLPGRPPLASFPENLVWNSGPRIGQGREAPAGAGLKRKPDDDDDILFLGERSVKR
ncbi:uncharacterized protein F4807DRAFT_207206 [Annulohypoxylon truncatum]|uniref:uncharacterized protein n=1 Tax=Annulohypoxylon truncatum TaxID=327061 RepID=UPI002007228D|nr:uncharacterized protein F4807DRAFT_207206 [Annulohypoxylon truncatum]KAI1213966.1 hypothetical protein F4807DRAFT_207206 [Annulohypoxylon truncatum]